MVKVIKGLSDPFFLIMRVPTPLPSHALLCRWENFDLTLKRIDPASSLTATSLSNFWGSSSSPPSSSVAAAAGAPKAAGGPNDKGAPKEEGAAPNVKAEGAAAAEAAEAPKEKRGGSTIELDDGMAALACPKAKGAAGAAGALSAVALAPAGGMDDPNEKVEEVGLVASSVGVSEVTAGDGKVKRAALGTRAGLAERSVPKEKPLLEEAGVVKVVCFSAPTAELPKRNAGFEPPLGTTGFPKVIVAAGSTAIAAGSGAGAGGGAADIVGEIEVSITSLNSSRREATLAWYSPTASVQSSLVSLEAMYALNCSLRDCVYDLKRVFLKLLSCESKEKARFPPSLPPNA